MSSYISPQDLGRKFEDYVHLFLTRTYKEILREKDIKKRFGNNNSGIDHLIISDNICICIQDKYEETSASISKVNHFILCVQNIQKQINKKCIGIYLSRLKVSGPSENSFIDQNKTNNDIYFVNIYDENNELLMYKLMCVLYEYNIFIYDDDQCTIYMIE